MCLRQSYTTGRGKYKAPAVMTRDRCYFLFWALMIHLHSYYPILLKSDFWQMLTFTLTKHTCVLHMLVLTQKETNRYMVKTYIKNLKLKRSL